MINEEAFFNVLPTSGRYLNDEEVELAEKVWQAAIAYMQEQNKPAEQIEPVAWIETDCIGERYLCFSKPNSSNQIIPLYTTQQRQQPLKRLSQLDVLKILNECAKSPYTNTQSSLGFADAIMNAMQEINK